MLNLTELDELETEIHYCTKCDLARKINPHPFSHYLLKTNKEAKFLFVGRNPGLEHVYSADLSFQEYQDLYHSKFVESRFGKYLLSAVGLDVLTQSMFTNAVKCPTEKNEEPSTAQYTTCFPYLMRQIEIAKPQKIFVFGRSIVRSMAISCGAMRYPTLSRTYKGFNKMDIIKYETPETSSILCSLILLYHPSYFDRGGSADIAKRQIELLKEECK